MRKVTEDFIGTCQACFGEFKVNEKSQLIVLHGYQRPGIGFILGDCQGTAYLPFEYDTSLTKRIIQNHLAEADKQQKLQSELSTLGYAGPLTRRWDEYNRDTRRNEPRSEEVTPGHDRWDWTLKSAIQMAIARHNHHTRFAAFLQAKVDAWTRGQIVGLDVPATGKERALRKAYDPVEADAMEERAKIKAARDAKPGKLRVLFYRKKEWGKSATEIGDSAWREQYTRLEKSRTDWRERIKTWCKTSFEGKLIVREGSDYDLPRHLRGARSDVEVTTVSVDWNNRDLVKGLLVVTDERFEGKKKIDYFVEGEPG